MIDQTVLKMVYVVLQEYLGHQINALAPKLSFNMLRVL